MDLARPASPEPSEYFLERLAEFSINATLRQRSNSMAANPGSNTVSITTSHPGATHSPEVAWRQWLAENGSRMLLFARQQTRNAHDAEDVLQDALVKLARKVEEGTFDGGQESWKPYLYTAIRRLAIDLGRKNDRRTKREEKSETDRKLQTGGMADPWFESNASNDETRDLLEQGIKKLPDKFAEVIILKIWGEHTFAEIGEMLDVSLNTVASRYRYGLERLRKNLDGARRAEDI